MRFIVSGDQQFFFNENGYVEFEGLLSDPVRVSVTDVIDRSLAKPGKKTGRDLWREYPQLQKLVCKKNFAEVTSQLTGEKAIRLGCDQVLSQDTYYMEGCLEDTICMQAIVAGLLFCLRKGDAPSPYPQEVGNGVILHPHVLLPPCTSGLFYLVVYGRAVSLYSLQEGDPNVHFWKGFGYVFGDKLTDDKHPRLL